MVTWAFGHWLSEKKNVKEQTVRSKCTYMTVQILSLWATSLSLNTIHLMNHIPSFKRTNICIKIGPNSCFGGQKSNCWIWELDWISQGVQSIEQDPRESTVYIGKKTFPRRAAISKCNPSSKETNQVWEEGHENRCLVMHFNSLTGPYLNFFFFPSI